MSTSVESASDGAASECLNETPSNSEIVPTPSSSDLPPTDLVSTAITDSGPEISSAETPLVEASTAERAHEGGSCLRFLVWARGITLRNLFGVMITTLVIFLLILASFLSGNWEVMVTTAAFIGVIVIPLLCFFAYKLIQILIENRQKNRQNAETGPSNQERGTQSSSEYFPSSTPTERDSEPAISSIESETSTHRSASKSPSREEKAEPGQIEKEESISGLSTKSDKQVILEEESVRQRHKSNDKTG